MFAGCFYGSADRILVYDTVCHENPRRVRNRAKDEGGKDVVKIALLTLMAGALFITTIFYAGIQGADSGMSIWRLGLRFLIFCWMVSIFDAVVLDWWMFTKTDIFGLLIKLKTGKKPGIMRVDRKRKT